MQYLKRGISENTSKRLDSVRGWKRDIGKQGKEGDTMVIRGAWAQGDKGVGGQRGEGRKDGGGENERRTKTKQLNNERGEA